MKRKKMKTEMKNPETEKLILQQCFKKGVWKWK